MPGESFVQLRTLDGLHLASTFVGPDAHHQNKAVVLVHGGGVTREEGGFFTRLAAGLADAGVASLRFDLRGHGEIEGSQHGFAVHDDPQYLNPQSQEWQAFAIRTVAGWITED